MTGTEAAPGRADGRSAHLLEWLLILVTLPLLAFSLHAVILGDSASSRLATVYSLVHDGTWYISGPPEEPPNPFEPRTIDKVEIDGRLISTKPPLLPLAMTAEYVLLRNTVGWDLQNQDDWKPVLQSMIVLLNILPHFIGIVFFAMILDLLIDNPWRRLLPLAALAYATQLPGFATELNNHTPAVAALIVALYFAIGLCTGKLAPAWHRFLGFGVAGALVFTLDMPVTVFVAAAGVGLLWKFPRQAAGWGALGMLPILALHFGVMLYVTGSPLPVQMHKDLYLYEAAAWRNPGRLDALNEPKGTYLFHMTFGRFGIFLLYPILLAGLVGCVFAFRREMAAWRWYYVAGTAATALLFFYYVKGTNNYGGAAYGFRWGMGAMPILILMGIPVFNRIRSAWGWTLVAVLMGVSLFSAWECYQLPWGECHEWTCRWLFGAPYRT